LEEPLATTTGGSRRNKKVSGPKSRKAIKSAPSPEVSKGTSGIKTLFDSAFFRNVVAAGLAAAAAALVSRASNSSSDVTSETPVRDEPLDGRSSKEESPPLTAKVRKKTKEATAAVTEAAGSVTSGNAVNKVAKKAKKAVKSTKAALTRADNVSGAPDSNEGTQSQVQPRLRKVRSDAGSRRKPKVQVEIGTPSIAAELPIQPDTETSTLAIGAGSVPEEDGPFNGPSEVAEPNLPKPATDT
jgi:hypothetical protein